MTGPVSSTILDAAGRPMRSPARRLRAGLGGQNGNVYPYDAGNPTSDHGAAWHPSLRSADGTVLRDRDRIVARSRDLVRNDGWAGGGVTTILDQTVGLTFRLSAKPDYRALSRLDRRLDATWAAEFSDAAEAEWRLWSNDPLHYNDVARRMTIEQQFWLQLRHRVIDGDCIALLYWMPDRIGPGGARYAMAVRLVHPDRLSNPQGAADDRHLRGGVEIDGDDVPVAYHFRKGDQNDYWVDSQAMEWERVTREVAGYLRVIHSFETLEIGQNRGVGVFAPVVNRLKMLIRYDGAELDAAIINAIFATFVTSPFDTEFVQGGLSEVSDDLDGYQKQRVEFHDEAKLMLGSARLAHLYPGEKLETVAAARPSGSFDAFSHAMLRNVAAQLGLSAEQLTKDWSKSNYSSARGALQDAWKTMTRRRRDFALSYATPIYAGFLWEAMEAGRLPLPAGAPAFEDARAGYAAAKWIGPGRGWIDPVKEREGAVLGMESGLSTLEDEAAENGGGDWEENLDQRALEVAAFKARGLPLPAWAGPSKDPGLMNEGQRP